MLQMKAIKEQEISKQGCVSRETVVTGTVINRNDDH